MKYFLGNEIDSIKPFSSDNTLLLDQLHQVLLDSSVPALLDLETRVNLVDKVAVGPGIPCRAKISCNLWEGLLSNVGWSLQDVNVQTTADVPGNVAMGGPDSWIILSPLENNVRWSGGVWSRANELDVAHLRVAGVGDCAVPCTNTLIKDMEVVTMDVNWMSAKSKVVVKDETN